MAGKSVGGVGTACHANARSHNMHPVVADGRRFVRVVGGPLAGQRYRVEDPSSVEWIAVAGNRAVPVDPALAGRVVLGLDGLDVVEAESDVEASCRAP